MLSQPKSAGIRLLFLLLVAFVAAACGKRGAPEPSESNAAAPKAESASGEVTLTGSGASFPAPLYSRWFSEFSKKDAQIRVNYQATGSGAGIKAFSEGQTDFGASDAAMSDEELKAAGFDILMLPMTAGSIALSYNLEGIADLKLSREVYVDIFLGKITNWNDAKIKADNPEVKLPDEKITVVRRSDGSGTTFVFTSHLAAISEAWKASPGAGKSVEFPVGVGGRQNDGVAALIKQTPGAIGYVEYGYAASTGLPMAKLQNKAGEFVSPTLEAASAALAAVKLPDNLRAWVSDPDGKDSYPIVTYTWLLVKKKYADKAKADAIKKLIDYSLSDGQKLAPSLFYVELPPNVISAVRKSADAIN